MPPIIITIVGAIEMLIRVAPGIQSVVQKAKDLVASLFEAKLITAAEQKALFDRIDAIAIEALAGNFPAWWKVEDDPPETPD